MISMTVCDLSSLLSELGDVVGAVEFTDVIKIDDSPSDTITHETKKQSNNSTDKQVY